MEALPGLQEELLDLEVGVSPGFGGFRNEFWTELAKVWTEEEMK